MLFHTWIFLAFFVIVYSGYLLVKDTWLKLPWLLAASYVFYGWWNPVYLLLILWSTTVDFLAVLAMAKTRWKRIWLALSIVNNMGMLGFFKYGNFVVDNLNKLAAMLGVPFALDHPQASFLSDAVNTVLSWTHIPAHVPAFDYLLPVGISFYVFQSMSYTIDFYRGQVAREKNFIRYATFVSLFPQLVAGPIERASNLLPQLHTTPRITRTDVADGLSLFVVGLFKKVALADYLAMYVDPVYKLPDSHQAPALLLATFAFAWQIYFDFSGYTDMARGVGRLFGIRLMLNFNNPYLATGLGDFWRRWHISLSTWFRDYVYIPLGGNRRGEAAHVCEHGPDHAHFGTVAWSDVDVHPVGRRPCFRTSPDQVARTNQFLPRSSSDARQTSADVLARHAGVGLLPRKSTGDAWLILQRILTSGWTDPLFPLLLAALVASVWLYQYIYESRLRRRSTPLLCGLVWSWGW